MSSKKNNNSSKKHSDVDDTDKGYKFTNTDGEVIRYLGDTTPDYYRNGGNGRTGKFGKKMKSKKRRS